MQRWSVAKLLLIGMVVLWSFSISRAEEPSWRIWINIPECRLYLYCDSRLYQSYRIAVGRPTSPSPVGDFWIANKVTNPTWYPKVGHHPVQQGPSNPLGQYWLGLSIKGYGIHGNNSPSSIGNPVSNGCFRMDNFDIGTIFQLVPVGTPVQVTYHTVRGEFNSNQEIELQVFPDIYHRCNLKEEAKDLLQKLAPGYQPHEPAWMTLLETPSVFPFTIPRLVKINTDSGNWDGFYWNGNYYVAQTDPDPNSATMDTNGIFPGYHALSEQGQWREKFCIRFNDADGEISIRRYHLFLNDQEADAGLRCIDRIPYLDLAWLAKKCGMVLGWDCVSSIARIDENTITGVLRDGGFWVDIQKLKPYFPDLNYVWDEDTAVLRATVSNMSNKIQ